MARRLAYVMGPRPHRVKHVLNNRSPLATTSQS